jgi:hypothetical protein
MRAAPRVLRVVVPVVALLGAGSLFGMDPCCQAVDLSGGGWSGRWSSCTTGHNGPLRARFKKLDNCHYRVTFYGRFRVVIPFRYAMTMTVVGQEGDKVFLSGSSQVPFYGLFHFNGWATEQQFDADYWSEKKCEVKDRGKFVMSRCGRCSSCCDE